MTERPDPPEIARSRAPSLALRILSGPIAFAVVQTIPLAGLKPTAHLALSCFVWVLAWWVTTPVPWAVAGFLPLVLFPPLGVMTFADTVLLYGQRVFPFLLGVMLFGHAFEKHGLARRMAIAILSMRGVAVSGARLVLMILIVSAIISSVIDDAAAVAIMMPIALSVTTFAAAASVRGPAPDGAAAPRLMEASSLAVLYGASAGGMATPAGVPFNPLAISLLDQLTGYRISFAQWSATGFILAAATLPVFYGILIVMSRPEVKSIEGGAAYFGEEKKRLGALSQAEKNVLFVLIVMIALWLSPVVFRVEFLDIWYVPPLAMVLLFILPSNVRTGEMTLGSKDYQNGVAWNILFLVVSGTALASASVKLGITEWLGGLISAGVSPAALPWFAGFVTPIMSHLGSGTASTSLMCTVLFPISASMNGNPAVLARIIAGTALAVSLPWAGAAAATTFAFGAIPFGTMFRIGIVATILTTIVITSLSMVLVPALGAYTAP